MKSDWITSKAHNLNAWDFCLSVCYVAIKNRRVIIEPNNGSHTLVVEGLSNDLLYEDFSNLLYEDFSVKTLVEVKLSLGENDVAHVINFTFT